MTRSIQGLNYLAQMKPENIWMIAVDGKFYKIEKGPLGFDKREPKSVLGIIKGLAASINEIDKPLTVELLDNVYSECVAGVATQNKAEVNKLRENEVGFEVLPGWYTKEGLLELAKEEKRPEKLVIVELASLTDAQLEQLPSKFRTIGPAKELVPYSIALQYLPHITRHQIKVAFTPDSRAKSAEIESHFPRLAKSECTLYYKATPPAEIKARRLAVLAKYHQDLIAARDDSDAILSAIALMVKELCKTHCYKDANNRTFVNCILNSQLMKHGFPFVLLNEPNIFEFHTVPQIVEILKNGMAAAEALLKFPESPVYEFRSAELPASEFDKYTKIGKFLLRSVAIKAHKMGAEAFQHETYKLASQSFDLAYKLKVLVGEPEDQSAANCLLNLAKATQRLGEQQKAKQHFLTAQSMFGKLNIMDKVACILDHLKELEADSATHSDKLDGEAKEHISHRAIVASNGQC